MSTIVRDGEAVPISHLAPGRRQPVALSICGRKIKNGIKTRD
jgi:hypothetical protein